MGLELELLSSKLPPIRTAAAAASLDGDDNAVLDGCSTPTLAATVLPPPLVCPPAPRKPRPPVAKIRKLQRRGRPYGPTALRPAPVRWFIAVPQDVLAAVFVAQPAASAPPASKKIRVHVVG
ncbi:hypothetical protein SETIT_1G067100v2 [Setaria italica]|uniref:Uncharacterized protein n=1 Tax=Setaria italica TaxID=4555 RepID=A0A368PJM6_SETIT|nr:hypothetical protein SETIT_1G067100v2 [Setaria italica]